MTEVESLRAEAVGDALFRRDPEHTGLVLFGADGGLDAGERAFRYADGELVFFLAGDRAEALAEAERLRAALGPVSGGIVHASETTDIVEAVALARARAGRGGDRLHAEGGPAEATISAHVAEPDLEALTELAERRGRTVPSLLREAVGLLGAAAPSEPPWEDDGESPESNLRRIFADSLRVAAGEARLDEALAAAGPDASFAILLVDLDSSATVRARGIAAKIDVVRQLQHLVSAELREDEWLIDSGTRDEIYVVLPGATADEAARAGERIRARVAGNPFALADGTDVALTCCVGAAAREPGVRCGFDLMWTARHALGDAKRTRNAVALFAGVRLVPVQIPSTVDQADRLRGRAVELGRSEQSLVNEALLRLFDRHKGVWHWAVEQWPPFAAI